MKQREAGARGRGFIDTSAGLQYFEESCSIESEKTQCLCILINAHHSCQPLLYIYLQGKPMRVEGQTLTTPPSPLSSLPSPPCPSSDRPPTSLSLQNCCKNLTVSYSSVCIFTACGDDTLADMNSRELGARGRLSVCKWNSARMLYYTAFLCMYGTSSSQQVGV